MAVRIYAGWWIYGERNEWAAVKQGVRMRANSQELLITMIDLRDDKFEVR